MRSLMLTERPSPYIIFFNFQANSNQIADWKCVDNLQQNKKLATVYLEHNPIGKDVQYRKKIKLALPQIQKIDATLCK